MNRVYDPRIGDWYRNEAGETFEIVARDESERTLELQYFDGTIDEVDLNEWGEMTLEPIDPPEDWHGALDLDEFEESDAPELNRLRDDLDNY